MNFFLFSVRNLQCTSAVLFQSLTFAVVSFIRENGKSARRPRSLGAGEDHFTRTARWAWEKFFLAPCWQVNSCIVLQLHCLDTLLQVYCL